jgi:hypothetical protein
MIWKWRTLAILLLIFLALWAGRDISLYWSNRLLSSEALALSSQLTDLSSQVDYQDHAGEDSAHYAQRIDMQNNDVRLQYAKNYAGKVDYVRHEMARRGLSDEELDRYYENPANPIVIRTVGTRIAFLVQELKHQ